MPISCEPCALLSNPANRGRKHGKGVLEQIAMLEYAPAPADEQIDRRGLHKRWQVESFVLVLRRLVEADPQRQWHVVDFGCGTGALLLPLACLFPSCHCTGVEMKPAALAILRQRAAAAGLTNVSTFVGMIEGYEAPFDVALALHACGNATDAALLRAEQHRAAYVVSPCCVGKLKFSMQGGSSFSSEAGQWRWMPRMAGSREEVGQAGAQLLVAAGGDPLAVSELGRQSEERGAGRGSGSSSSAPSDGALSGCGPSEGSRAAGVQGAGDAPGPPDTAPGGPTALPPLRHPRSDALLRLLSDPQHFKLLAQVADTNHHMDKSVQPQPRQDEGGGSGSAAAQHPDVPSVELARALADDARSSTSTGDDGAAGTAEDGNDTARKAAHCALAKLHVELDRNEAAREAGYAVCIFRMINAGRMAKGDLLVGVPGERQVWAELLPLLQPPVTSRGK